MNWVVLALAGASLPALAYIGYNEGINSFLINQQEREEMDLLFKRQDSSFHKRAVVPPIRRLIYPDFTVFYSTTLRVPLAVQEKLTKKQDGTVYTALKKVAAQEQLVHSPPFFRETLLRDDFATTDSSYSSSSKLNLVRGQLADFDNSRNRYTFTYTNTIPQNKDNKQDTWRTFETYQRDLLRKCDSVDVVSGPMFGAENQDQKWKIYEASYKRLGKYGPAIPTKLFKIIRCNKKEGSYVGGFVFNNTESDDKSKLMGSFQVPIQSISQKTGLTFNLSGASLTKYESDIFTKTKEQYDWSKIEEPILQAENWKSLKEPFRLLRVHKLDESHKIIAVVKKLGLLEMNRISKDEKLLDCERIEEYLQLRIDIGNSKSAKEISGQLKKLQDSAYKVCINRQKLTKIREKLVHHKEDVTDAAHRIKQIDGLISDQKIKHPSM